MTSVARKGGRDGEPNATGRGLVPLIRIVAQVIHNNISDLSGRCFDRSTNSHEIHAANSSAITHAVNCPQNVPQAIPFASLPLGFTDIVEGVSGEPNAPCVLSPNRAAEQGKNDGESLHSRSLTRPRPTAQGGMNPTQNTNPAHGGTTVQLFLPRVVLFCSTRQLARQLLRGAGGPFSEVVG